MKEKKAIIIGAGVAGLASAIRLVVQGFEVEVYEKNETFGGKIGYFENNGFCFDSGPSLFTQPENIKELFQLAGEPIEQYFSYKNLPLACKYFYEDGTVINAFTNADEFANELNKKSGENASAVKKYLDNTAALYQNVGEIFINHSLHKRSTWINAKVAKALFFTQPKYLFRSLNKLNSKSFSKPHSIQIFNRFGTYNGSDPYRMTGMFSMIAHLEHNEGIAYPDGGMISIARALYSLALKKGVQFYFNTAVQTIILNEGKVLGIVCNDENHFANVVVSNVDAYFTYKNLLRENEGARKIFKKERSSSAVVFYWGMNALFPELDLHNIFFSINYKAEFYHLFKTKKIYPDPTIYINITSKQEPEVHAPAGKENWFVMINMPSGLQQDDAKFISQLREAVIKKLSRILKKKIEEFIETENVMDPKAIENNTNAFCGALYGTSSNARLASFLRHPNFNKKIKGLYFAGGTVHPGGGIPLCLKSAKIVSELIKNDIQHTKH